MRGQHNSLNPITPSPVRILSISQTLYRRGSGKGQLRACPRIQICETCFERFLTAADSRFMQTTIALRLLNALRESLAKSYSNLLNEEAAN
jgi:hypothetical protein